MSAKQAHDGGRRCNVNPVCAGQHVWKEPVAVKDYGKEGGKGRIQFTLFLCTALHNTQWLQGVLHKHCYALLLHSCRTIQKQGRERMKEISQMTMEERSQKLPKSPGGGGKVPQACKQYKKRENCSLSLFFPLPHCSVSRLYH